MTRRTRIYAALAASIAVAAGCGYPTFSYGPGTGGSGGTTASSSSVASSSSAASSGSGGTTSSSSTGGASSSSTSASSSGLPPCGIGHLVISEVRTRGPAGAYDEFVELYNPTEAPVTLDGHWTIDAHALDANVHQYSTRWTGQGLVIPARKHFLIRGSSFTDVAADDSLSVGLTDAASMRLLLDGNAVDVVCYYEANNPGSATGFLNVLEYQCSGLPVGNPHDGTDMTDASIERKPGGTAGNCTDTNSNFDDFVAQAPSTPLNTQAPPTP